MLFLLVFLQSFVYAQTDMCIGLEKPLRALKINTDPKVFVPIYAQEPVQVVATTKNNKFFKIKIAEEFYWLPQGKHEAFDAKKCQINLCVALKSNSTVYASPQRSDPTQVTTPGTYSLVSSLKGWYRVKTTDGFLWMTGKDVRATKTSCSLQEGEIQVTQLPSSKDASPSKWQFGFEFGYLLSTPKDPLENLLTGVPPPGDDVNSDSYDSPFIDSVSDGSGWFLGGTIEFPMFWNLRNQLAVGYKTRSLEFVQRNNPNNTSISFITYDQLTPETLTQDFSFVYVSTTVKMNGFQMLGITWQPGFLLGIDYSLDEMEVEFRTAPSKLTQYFVQSGYQEIEFLYGPKLDMSLGFFHFGLSAIFTQYGMEPTIILAMQF